MSLELIARINELAPNPNCVLKVLDNILPHCNAPEDVADRTWLGVQLSICEFDAAGISYPDSCRQFDTLMECTGLLESKSTWWTTFSGNYRYISTICSEHRSEYEMENIVKLYQNISGAMYDYYQGHNESVEVFRKKFDEAMESTNNWKVTLSSLSKDLETLTQMLANSSQQASSIPQHLLKVNNEMDVLTKKSTVISSNLYDVETVAGELAKVMSLFYSQLNETLLVLTCYKQELTTIHAMMAVLGNLSEDLAVKNTMLLTKLDTMAIRLDDYDNRQNQSISRLESAVNSTASKLELATNHLETSVTKVISYLMVLKSFSSAVQLLFYASIIVSVWRLSFIYRRYVPEEDLTFY